MTPELRLDRAERLLLLIVKAGNRERRAWRLRSREQEEKINMVINAHIEGSERLDKLAAAQAKTEKNIEALFVAQAETEKTMDKLAESHEATERSLKAFLDGLRKGPNGNSST